METVVLPSGQAMPMLGFGTYRLQGSAGTRAVREAIDAGYRHFDTAAMYGNHKAVGRALAESGVDCGELFVTTKVWSDSLRAAQASAACEKALKELGAEYLDLYLIHWPNADVPLAETLGVLARLQDEGKIRNFGISNFTIRLVDEAVSASPAPIAINQVEYHALLNQERLRAHCEKKSIVLTAYCPLGRGKLTTDPTLAAIGETRGKTAAQVALRWLIQKGICAIPKSGARERIRSNFEVFDFQLSAGEMGRVDALSSNDRQIDPGWVDFDT